MFSDQFFYAGWLMGDMYNISRGIRDVATSQFSFDEHYTDTVIQIIKEDNLRIFNRVYLEKFKDRDGNFNIIVFNDNGKEKAKRIIELFSQPFPENISSYHRELGMLFGYSVEKIDEFINSWIEK